ncbi:MAG: hypothetical protein AB8B69_04775 [Chitinophagales bacterium]
MVRKVEGELTITVEDDGKGFDVAEMQVKGGLGLKSIQSRTNYLKGKFEVYNHFVGYSWVK